MKKFVFTLLLLLSVALAVDAQQEFWYEGVHYRALDYYNVEVIQANDSIYSGRVVIPRYVLCETVDSLGIEHVEGFEVTAIADSAFFKCSNLTSVVFPKSLLYIGKYAFFYCTGLTSLDFPQSVTNIDNYAFYHCSGLVSINLSNTVQRIGRSAFSFCGVHESIPLPNSITTIEPYAFFSTRIRNLVVPGSLEVLNQMIFADCDLKQVTISHGVKKICNGAFDYASFTSIDLPNSVEVLDGGSFSNCRDLVDVNLGDSVKRMTGSTFYGCWELEYVEIPNSVTYMGGMNFHLCKKLKTVKFSNNVDTIGYGVFYLCDSIRDVVFPNSLKYLDGYACYGCKKLKTVTLGKSLEFIGNDAFDEVPLESIVSLNRTPPYTVPWSLRRSYETATLYVPKQSVEAYQSVEPWMNFVNIVGIDVEPDPGDINDDGKIDVSDVTGLVDLMLSGGELPAYADFNGDGVVSINDVTDIIDYLLTRD